RVGRERDRRRRHVQEPAAVGIRIAPQMDKYPRVDQVRVPAYVPTKFHVERSPARTSRNAQRTRLGAPALVDGEREDPAGRHVRDWRGGIVAEPSEAGFLERVVMPLSNAHGVERVAIVLDRTASAEDAGMAIETVGVVETEAMPQLVIDDPDHRLVVEPGSR